MTTALLAAIGGYSIIQVIVLAIVVVAVIAVVAVLCRTFEVWPPPWVITIAWICLAAFVGILAVRFLWSLI